MWKLEGMMFFLEKNVYFKMPEKWQKICKTWVFLADKIECEIFALKALQIHSAINKTDPGDKLCRAGSGGGGRNFFEVLWGIIFS